MPIIIEKKGMNYEYTGSNERIMKESKRKILLTSLETGIKKMMLLEGMNI